MNILIFTGAGASVELEVPAMRQMTEQLLNFLNQQDFNQAVLDRLRRHLQEPDYDMESLVDQIDSIVEGLAEVKDWKENVDLSGLEREGLRALRHDAEWFIQHACERVRLRDARNLWGPALRELQAHDVTVATTNYDRSVELAAAGMSVPLNDGFGSYEDSEVAEWQGYKANGINYLKLHGSTNWYRSDNGEVYKLRHPMKLFGDLRLTVPGTEDALVLNSALVLPSREKVKRSPPYDDIGYKFRSEYEKSGIAIFIGTSLRDPDIKKAAEKCSQNMDTFMVEPKPNTQIEKVNGDIKPIKATTSQFLCSILPVSVSDAHNVSDLRDNINYYSQKVGAPNSILEDVVEMFDDGASESSRAASIERLSEMEIPMLGRDIKKVMDTEDPLVKRYSLGLVTNSPDREELTEFADDISRNEGDDKFDEELDILKNKITE